MLKVMLVDDEVQILKGMKVTMDWMRVGCRVVCEAFNGRDGLEKAMEFKPDIIITDITMPVMDGIEMSERLKDLLPETRIIFLTCHEDFYYAKQALKLNISDYLVKETMSREELYAVLKKTGKEINLEKELREKTVALAKELDENRILVGESIINGLIEGNTTNFEEIEKRLDFYNYRLKDRYYLLSILAVEKNIGPSEAVTCGDSTPYKHTIFNTIHEILKRHYCGEVFVKNQDEFIMICYFPEYKINSMEEKVTNISEEILESLKIKIRHKCSVFVGGAFDSLEKLPEAYNKAKQMKDKRFYLSDSTILIADRLPVLYTEDGNVRNSFLASYKEAIITFDLNAVTSTIAVFVKKSLQLRFVVREVKNTFERAFDMIADMMENYGCKFHQLSSVPYNEIISEASDIFMLSDLLIDFSKRAIELSKQNADLIASPEIKKIIQYLCQHLHENLTLESMASMANMNSSYFSRYFKLKTGEKFVDYLSKVRVEKAKRLLRETHLPLDEILEKVGHINQGYFIKVFKKATGMSPVEYRRKCNP